VPALRRYADALGRLEPRPWVFFVDGERRAGEFLLVEVLNGSAVGPNLELAPGNDPCDGRLTVVTAGIEHREQIAEYIAGRLGGAAARLALPAESAALVEVNTPHPMHVDDELMDAARTPLTIRVAPGAVTVLLPGAAG
jgi:diacylglycerol kinase family enzyme